MKERGYDSHAAYTVMYGMLGGVPRKHFRAEPNALTMETYNKLSQLVAESMLAEDGA